MFNLDRLVVAIAMKRIVFKDQDHGTNKYDSSVLNDFNDSDNDSNDNKNNHIKNESINNSNDNIKNESINISNDNIKNEKPDSKDIETKMNAMNANKPWNKWGDSFDWNTLCFTNFGNKYKSVKSAETTLPTEESFGDNDSDKDEEELNF